MRITIIGLPGSGKTYLAQRIAEKMYIPHIHIDRFWLEGGGGQNSRGTPNPEQVHAHVEKEVLKAIQQESWVSDGFYSMIQPEIARRADTVLFLNLPLSNLQGFFQLQKLKFDLSLVQAFLDKLFQGISFSYYNLSVSSTLLASFFIAQKADSLLSLIACSCPF